jgi:hypothetical protein
MKNIRATRAATLEIEATYTKISQAKTKMRAAFHIFKDVALHQKFLDVSADYVGNDLKASVAQQNVNLCLVAALIVGMVFGGAMSEDGSWIEAAQTGWISRNIYPFFDDWTAGYWRDICVAGWNLSTVCFLMCLVSCVLQLFCINELDEAHMQSWIKNAGPFAKKVPVRLLILGFLFSFGIPYTIRTYACMQSLAGLLTGSGTGVFVAMLGYAIFAYLYGMWIAIDESQRHVPIEISQEEANKLAEKYFEDHPNDYDLHDFLSHITETSAKGWKVPLNYTAQVRAKKCFYIMVGRKEGIKVEDGEHLMHLCF